MAQPPQQAPASAQPAWNLAAWWLGIGWLMLFGVVLLSLVSIALPVGIEHADKYEHLLAYAVMMYWWGMVQPHRRWRWAAFLPLLGLGLEIAQWFNPGRHMEWQDAAANTAGVLIGLALLATPMGKLLGWLDRQLANRPDAGLS